MPIRHIYGPQAGTLAGVAGAIGTSRGQQDAAKQQAELDRMTLGALLQDRSQQADFNFRAAGMYQGAQQQNAQAEQELQRQQIGLNLAAQQQSINAYQNAWNQQANLAADAWQNQQQLAQREQLIQQEMQQKQFEYDLRNRSQAQAAYQDLTSQEQALQRALDDGFVTQEQYGQMRGALAQKLAGFDPTAYPRDSQFPEGQDMGEVWQETRQLPGMGEVPLNFTRDRNGVPTLTRDSEMMLEAQLKQWMEKQKPAEMQGAPNAGKPTVTMKDFASMYESISKTLAPETIDAEGNRTPGMADPAAVEQRMQQMIQSYRQNFDPNTPGAAGQQLGPGMSVDLNAPRTTPGPVANTQGMRFGGQEQPLGQGMPQIEALKQGRMPQEWAAFVVQVHPDIGLKHLEYKYPGGEQQLRATGDPYDTFLIGAFAQAKQRALR